MNTYKDREYNRKTQRGRGSFLQVEIIEQFNTKDVIFKGRARANDREEVARLLKNLYFKGVNLPPPKPQKTQSL